MLQRFKEFPTSTKVLVGVGAGVIIVLVGLVVAVLCTGGF